MKHLVLGYGEVGTAIAEVLHSKELHDPQRGMTANTSTWYDFAHVCFPYTADFIDRVEEYRRDFTIGTVVVHSTVPVGTCDALGAVHSPVRGVHPHLAESIRQFVKYFGGPGASGAAQAFFDHGIVVSIIDSARNTEAMKLWETAQYGIFILIEKEIHRYCKEHGLNFDLIYSQANNTYNEGYERMGMSAFTRPILRHMEGPIGGHCVVPNSKLLESWIADLIWRSAPIQAESVEEVVR